MKQAIKHLSEIYEGYLDFDCIEDGSVVVVDNLNEVGSPLIEADEAWWTENLERVQVVLDWWVHEAGDEHRWAFENTNYNLPTIYMERKSICEKGVGDEFWDAFSASFGVSLHSEYSKMQLLDLIDEGKAVAWLCQDSRYDENSLDAGLSFDDTFYDASIGRRYSWEEIPVDDADGIESSEELSDPDAKGE